MELKVWVDGIQRVVCGASYSTTCQDVVIALASAMGRTGRFTLVERWRDSERPLFPGECPLQTLHKWGEYAGEVKFYLVQAAADKIQQKEVSQQKLKSHEQKSNNYFTNNFSPAQPFQHYLKPSEAESLKRSSTFSGAHRTDFAVFPTLSLTSSQKSAALSHYSHTQQKTIPPSTSLVRDHSKGLASVPNGEVAGLLSASSSDSSSRSSSTSLTYLPQSNSSRGLHPVPPARRDAREFHPANMPEALSSYSSQTKDFYSHSAMVPSQQLLTPKPHPSLRQSPKPPASSSVLTHDVSSQSHISSAITAASQSFHSQQHQSSLSSQQLYPHSDHLQQLHHYKPSPQIQLSPSPVGRENIPFYPRQHIKPPQHRERSRYRNSQGSKSVLSSTGIQDPSKTFFSDEKKTETARTAILGASNHNGNVLYGDTNEATRVNQHGQGERNPHDYMNSFNSDIQEGSKSKDIFQVKSDNKTYLVNSATLDRHKPRSKVNKEVPSRSWSTGDHGDEQTKPSQEEQLSSLHPGSDMNQHRQAGGGSKLTFVDSALVRHKTSGTEGYNQRVSSFTSAVAHIRNHGDASLKAPKTETDVKHHVSDNNKEGGSFKEDVENVKMSSQGIHSLGESNIITNAHNSHQQQKHHMLQPSNKPFVPYRSVSSLRHNSAFTEVSPKSSHLESSSLLSSEPVAYNLDSFGPSTGSHQKHESSHSSQTSLEIEEYDLDQNFPDVSGVGGAKGDKRPSQSLKHVEVIPSQTDDDHVQLLGIVSLQQERITSQEAQINDASLEVAILEEEESNDKAKLEALAAEISQLEKQEAEFLMELQELEKTEWINVLDSESKQEADIKLQITSLKEKLEKMEPHIKQLNEEADKKSKDLKAEEKRIHEENKKNEEREKRTTLKIEHLKNQLDELNKTIDEGDKKLKDVEKKIQETDATLRQQEEKVNAFEEELKDEKAENSESVQAKPLPKEPTSNSVPACGPVSPGSVTTFSASDNGEAILKILEGQLSPHASTFPTGDGGGSQDGITSAQHLYKSAMAVKNPNGVWV